MRVVKLEIEVVLPDRMDDDDVATAVDHILDAGSADMALEVHPHALPPVISQSIAEDCVEMTIGDAKVVASESTRDSLGKTTRSKLRIRYSRA